MTGKTNSSANGEVISANDVMMSENELSVLRIIKQYNDLPDNIGKTREACFWGVFGCTTYSQFVEYLINRDSGTPDQFCRKITNGMLNYSGFIKVANRYNNQSQIKYNVNLGITRKLMFLRYVPTTITTITDDVNMVSNTVAVDISCNLNGGVLSYYSDDYSTIYISTKSGSKIVFPSDMRSSYFRVYDIGDTSTRHTFKELVFNNSVNITRANSLLWFEGGEYEKIDVLGLDLSGHTKLEGWFKDCVNLNTIDNLEFLDTSSINDMDKMFSGCTALSSVDVSGFDTANVTSMEAMFRNCTSLSRVDVSNFNLSNVVHLDYMFNNCTSLESIKMPDERATAPKYNVVRNMFGHCSSLQELDLSNFNTSTVDDFREMFKGCVSMRSIDFTNFNTSYMQYTESMFEGCISLTSLDLSSFNTSMVKDMMKMFKDCSSMVSVNLSSFDTSFVGYSNADYGMFGMFDGCSSLLSLDLSNFNTSWVRDMTRMFRNCSSLLSVNLSSFATDHTDSYISMFEGCGSLSSLHLPGFLSDHALPPFIMKDDMFKNTDSLGAVYVTRYVWDISSNPANLFNNSTGHMEYIN